MKPGPDGANRRHCEEITVVIGYEDFQSALRAMEMYQRFIEPGEQNATLKIWKFEPLGIPQLLQQATSDAQAADLIIVSVKGDRPLPLEATEWIERWRTQKQGEDAALLFLARPEFEDSPTAALAAAYLAKVAQDTGLKFFSHIHEELEGTSERHRPFRSSAIVEAIEHSCRHDAWGLNE